MRFYEETCLLLEPWGELIELIRGELRARRQLSAQAVEEIIKEWLNQNPLKCMEINSIRRAQED